MSFLINILNSVFDLLLYPFKSLAPIWGLLAISVLTGILMLIIFRYTSNQKAIKKAKDKTRAHILELVLYKDNLKVISSALANILKYNFAYLKQTIIPLVFIIIPMLLILIQLNFRYQYRPLKSGESALVKLKLGKTESEVVSLIESENLMVETPALYIPEENEYDWRVRIKNSGMHNMNFEINESTVVEKAVDASDNFSMIAPVRVNYNFLRMVFNPAENPLPAMAKVSTIEVSYPNRQLSVFGINVHWLVIFFVVSLVAAFSLKGLFKVEI